MTRDRKRKKDVRARQEATGQRYTRLARQAPPAPSPAERQFSLGELLAESAAGQEVDAWPSVDPAFNSSLLGCAVPIGTVLQLGGLLFEEGRHAVLTVESLKEEGSAVVSVNSPRGQRRLELVLTQAMAIERCRTAQCGSRPQDEGIAYCAEHLRTCGADELVEIARHWASWEFEEIWKNPACWQGSPDADALVRAAVHADAVDAVTSTLLRGLFDDPETLECNCEDVRAVETRYGIERERLRLRDVAWAEARRLRTAAA